MGKEKKEKRKSEILDESTLDGKELWEEKIKHLNGIAKPLASRKLAKKLYKTIKKAKSVKHTAEGVKDVQKRVRKGEKGVVVLAGDVHPIDYYSHFPVTLEEAGIPYCYVPAREDLGAALGKFACIIVLIKKHEDYEDLYNEVHTAVADLPLPL